jgi:hypothetical protein
MATRIAYFDGQGRSAPFPVTANVWRATWNCSSVGFSGIDLENADTGGYVAEVASGSELRGEKLLNATGNLRFYVPTAHCVVEGWLLD